MTLSLSLSLRKIWEEISLVKKRLLLTILMLSFSFALEVDVNPTTSLEKDHAYVISAIGLSNTGRVNYISGDSNFETGGTYRMAPQVIVYDGTTKFIGTATKFANIRQKAQALGDEWRCN